MEVIHDRAKRAAAATKVTRTCDDPTLSCCEEQDAAEAAYHARIRAATAVSNKRLFGRSLAAARAQSICTGLCCEDVECQCCEEDEEAEQELDGEAGADDESGEVRDARMMRDLEDDEEAELLMKMRAARLGQLHEAAQRKQETQRVIGYDYIEEGPLMGMLNDPASPPIVCLMATEDDQDVSQWLDDHLTAVAAKYPSARFVRAHDCSALLERVPFVRSLPTLLLFHGGLVAAVEQGLGDEREPELLRARIDRWLTTHKQTLAQRPTQKKAADDSDDDDDDDVSYCGRPGCRAYPHEHVQWGKPGA
tara:strand:+ start:906 stop:1826 length:921 start_codon:yes stop_codon:yes gene_type:complete